MSLHSDSFLCKMDIVNLKKFLFWILVSCPSPVPEMQAYPPRKLQAGTRELSFQNKHPHGRKRNPTTQNCWSAFVFSWGLHRVAVETKGSTPGEPKGLWTKGFKCSEPYSAASHHSIRQNLKWTLLWYLYHGKNNKTELKAPKQNPVTQNAAIWSIFCSVWMFLMTEHSLIIVGRLIKLYTKIIVGIIRCLVQERNRSKL